MSRQAGVCVFQLIFLFIQPLSMPIDPVLWVIDLVYLSYTLLPPDKQDVLFDWETSVFSLDRFVSVTQ